MRWMQQERPTAPRMLVKLNFRRFFMTEEEWLELEDDDLEDLEDFDWEELEEDLADEDEYFYGDDDDLEEN